MKKKFSKILGVGLTLALLISLLLTAAPVSANVSQPTVSITAATDEIGTAGKYTIGFRISEELVEATATISVRFPDDTDVPATFDPTDITLEGTSGIGSSAFTPVDVGDNATGSAQTVTIDLTEETWDGSGGNLPSAKIGNMADLQIVFAAAADVINPTEPGDYTLEVKTYAETTWVESTTYTIEEPEVGGTVYVYNPSDVLMAIYSGADALDSDNAGAYYGSADYTIEVGPGTYTPSATINIAGDGLTLQSTGGAAVTIIDGSSTGVCVISIHASDVTVEGFTVDDGPKDSIWIWYDTEGVTVRNNIIRNVPSVCNGIVLTYNSSDQLKTLRVTGATVSGNVIEGLGGIYLQGCAEDNTISDNTITGTTVAAIAFGSGTSADPTQGNTITGNTLTDNDGYGIWLFQGVTNSDFEFDDNLIEGNTISENEGSGIEIASDLPITNLTITGNDITDNEGVGIVVGSWTPASDATKFNNISGNDTTNGYGLQNASGGAVDATHNWWGTAVASEVAAMINDVGASDDTDYEPFLTDTVDAVFSVTAVDTGVVSLDAEDDVGVVVLTTDFDTNHVISAAKYIANPGAPLDNALAFYDVYATGTGIDADSEVVVKFYTDGIDENSVVYAWNELYDTWQECDPQDFSFWGGYVYVTIHSEDDTDDPTTPTIEALEGLPFAIVTGVRTLQSIAVTPATAEISVGGTQQFTATGTYNLAPLTEDITTTVTWASSVTSVATIDATGLATGVAEGTTNITATLDTIVSPAAVLTVTVFDPMVYDVDGSGVIEKDEVLAAVTDYFAGEITKAQALEVIALYFAS